MAVPKHKTTHSKKGMRRAHDWIAVKHMTYSITQDNKKNHHFRHFKPYCKNTKCFVNTTIDSGKHSKTNTGSGITSTNNNQASVQDDDILESH